MEIISKAWMIFGSLYPKWLRIHYNMDIGKNVVIAKTAFLDKNINPRGIHVGNNTWILRNAIVLAHDYCQGKDGRGKRFETYIGKNCVIGVNSIILPGVTVGDHCVVAAGAIVTNNAPSHSLLAGNPAKIIKTGLVINDKGQIIEEGKKIDV